VILLPYVYLLLIFFGMFLVCQELEKACGATAHRLRIPESVAGATLLAVASSAPEFFTAFLGAVQHGVFEVGLMAILWSAIFNITVIPGLSALVSPTPLKVAPAVVSRDCVAYLAITLLLMALLSDSKLDRNDALILLGAYFLYIYVLFLMLKADEEVEVINLPMWRIVVGMVGGIAIIGVLCHYMIVVGSGLTEAWGVSFIVVSALVFAPGTSVPDLFLSVFAARRGAGSAAVSNAFGSNSFDLTVCLAAPIMVLGEIQLDISGAVVWSVWMLIGTVVIAMVFVRTGYQLSKKEGVMLVSVFLILAVVLVLGSKGIIPMGEASGPGSPATAVPAVAGT
jgi:cation:H+ antiporter